MTSRSGTYVRFLGAIACLSVLTAGTPDSERSSEPDRSIDPDLVRSITFESTDALLSTYRFEPGQAFRIVFAHRGGTSPDTCVGAGGFERLLAAVTHTETVSRRRTRDRWPVASSRATLRIRLFSERIDEEVLELADPAEIATTAVILRPFERGAFVRETWRFPTDVGVLLRGGCPVLGAD